MDTKQLPIEFPVRKTRSATRQSTIQKVSDIESVQQMTRTPRLRRARLFEEPETPKTFCSPPKRQKGVEEKPLNSTPKSSISEQTDNVRTPIKQNQKNKENGDRTPPSLKTGKKLNPVSLFKPDVSPYQELKKALTTNEVASLCCRETEIGTVSSFLERHLRLQRAGSLYVSGSPGTGKTACLNQIVQAVKFERLDHKYIYINCTSLMSPRSVYERIFSHLEAKPNSAKCSRKADFQALVENQITNRKKLVVLVLDEIDYLESQNQNILYTIFEWPTLQDSKLLLIGIANALDLIDRVLPRLRIRVECKPTLVHFSAYSKDQIVAILQDRLSRVPETARALIGPAVIQYCARKVASVSGDIRKALDLCRRAVERVETDVRKQQILKPRTSPDGSNSLISSRESPTRTHKCVDLPAIVSVLDEVYGERLSKVNQHSESSLPIQQRVLLCSLILIIKNGRTQEITLGKLHEVYCRVCKKHQVTQDVDLSEFSNLCHLLDARGLLSVKKSKDIRSAKVNLKMNVSEVEYVLQDTTLLASILADPSCLKSK